MASSVLAEVGREERSFTPTLAPVVRALAVAAIIAAATVSYVFVARQSVTPSPYNPWLIAALLVANLIAGSVVLVLIGRSIARRRAARSPSGGDGQLHVRLVALFSTAAAVPMILVAIIASLLFQYGADFWSSGRARSMLENSQSLAQASYAELLSYVDNENVAMSADVTKMLVGNRWATDDPRFQELFAQDVYQRSLSNAVLFTYGRDKIIRHIAIVKNSDRDPIQDISPVEIARVQAGGTSVSGTDAARTHSLTQVQGTNLFLYATREGGAREMADRMEQARAVFSDYRALASRSRSLQLRFNAALLAISLLIVGIAVWIALKVADRLVRPIDELVGAARQVAGGDLSIRVHETKERDEVGTLGRVFNQMTGRLQEQNGVLESRRAFIEAVMAGVSAGVIATDGDRTITVANSSAVRLLGAASLPGLPLAQAAPALDLLVRDNQREAIIEVGDESERRTLAVRIARGATGAILTFDDITQQQLDQRRAAWADVARRIAHEIKNPLTPIQLAAERLQRRYGGKVDADDPTFARLTETIVRQVGDLRRMVDEFSSFARMPKPVFRDEPIVDIARQTLFLHEVAHPGIAFTLDAPDPPPHLVCDRRQVGQALTNIVKNAAEAIEATGSIGGAVTMTVATAPGHLTIAVADTGVGLPPERDRILEPYVTTRARGTGLGLAIVNKIVEEHFGTLTLSDRDGGGTVVTMTFDVAALAELDAGADHADSSGEEQLARLTSIRT